MSENESWKWMSRRCGLDSEASRCGSVTTSCKTAVFTYCNTQIIFNCERYILLSVLFIFYLMCSIIKRDWRQGTTYVWCLYYITSTCFRPLTQQNYLKFAFCCRGAGLQFHFVPTCIYFPSGQRHCISYTSIRGVLL